MTETECYPIIEAGVDWITATAQEQASRDRLVHSGLQLIEREERRGNQRKPWRFRDCVGYSAGQAFVAASPRLAIAQLTGAGAYSGWHRLLSPGVNVSRIDVQVTVEDVEPDRQLALEQWRRYEEADTTCKVPKHRSLRDTKPAGQTLYIGSPTSDRLLRLYDKHAESRGLYPPGTWRYECQARRRLAGVLASDLAMAGVAKLAAIGYVHQCYSRVGVAPHFRRSGDHLRDTVPRTRSDTDRTLRWLASQVRPAILRLALGGDADRLARALGSDLFEAIRDNLTCDE